MADEVTTTEKPAASGGGMKTTVVVAALLIAEAAIFAMLFIVFLREPSTSTASLLDPGATVDAGDLEVPLKVLGERLGNRKQGTLFIYDTEIFVYVRARNRDRMEAELERLNADLRAEIRGLWRMSDPRHFEEPGLETLTRQVGALIGPRLGTDPASGEPNMLRAVVSMMPGFRADP